MEEYIGCDAHKEFSVFVTMNERGEYGAAQRVGHNRQQMREYLSSLAAGSRIALEASGCYYWLVEEMEQAGHQPQLADPGSPRSGWKGEVRRTRKMRAD